MIRINLLSEGRRPTAVRRTPRGGFLERDDIAQWALLAITLVGLLIGGAWWIAENHKLKKKTEEVAAAQAEYDQLRAIIQEVEDYQAKKVELTHKIEVIKNLKDNQRGPVRLMDNISRSLPELLWLEGMQMNPTSITLGGQAFNYNAIARFLENLDRVPEFSEPVLRDSSRRGRVYNFTVQFNYTFAPREAGGEGGSDDKVAVSASG